MRNKIPLFNSKIQITIQGFHTLLILVLNYNFFIFKNKFYKQIKGVPMGTIVGPCIANIYIYILEEKWLTIHRPLDYSRYIDDLFLIVVKEKLLEIIQTLNSSFDNLKLNIEYGDKVNFLDLNIKINKVSNTRE